MKIVLNQQDIETALEDFVLSVARVPDNLRIDIDLKATRGDEGYQAFIEFVPINNQNMGEVEVTPEAQAEGLGIVEKINAAKSPDEAPRRRGRPPGSKNKPKDSSDIDKIAVNEPQTDAELAAQILGQDKPVKDQTPVADTPQETTQEAPVQPVAEEVTTDTVMPAEAPVEAAPAEPETPLDPPVEEAPVSLGVDEVPSEAVEAVSEAQPETAPVETAPQSAPGQIAIPAVAEPVTEAPAPVRNTLFGDMKAPVNEPVVDQSVAPAPTVAAGDVTAQATETLKDTLSDSTEKSQEVLQAEQPVATPVTPVAAPTRSLFANR